eukprot:Gregarina_sp_Pseudo_9__3818@NODE_396_length_2929_cov_14_471972_g373_i0_p1_GENE_NODE_396_length_2929_cov_14_471972_g373_i0NODE_396_length_2929_cov_14_471972_g373_i0_p1_ORF_typecomplete_len495_score198_03NUT/PF12881_7/8_3e02NUT/PF12881_7/1_1e03NUT/PF12881_7/0_56_NODE_396_length_2929_cov_14_471972_g373_i0391523
MFRCCQTPIQHGNELTFDSVQFPKEVAAAQGQPSRANARWRQIAGGASPPAPSPLELRTMGSISTASPRKVRVSRKSTKPRAADPHHSTPETASPPTETPSPPEREESSKHSAEEEARDEVPALLLTHPATNLAPSSPSPSSADFAPAPTISASPAAVSVSPAAVSASPAAAPSVSPAISAADDSLPVAPSLPPVISVSPALATETDTQVAAKETSSTRASSPSAASPPASPRVSARRAPSPSPRDASPSPANVAANPFKMRETAAPAKSPRLNTGRPPPPSARSAGSPGGLRTKDRSKMVDLLDDKTKKDVMTACNFVRETIEADPVAEPQVCEREAAFVLWALVFTAQLEAAGKQHPAATACAHVMDLAQGELATNAAKRATPFVHFFTKAIVRPTLENLLSPDPKHDALYVAQDIRDTARVTLGERPPGLPQRTPYLEHILTNCDYPRLRNLPDPDKAQLLRALVEGMEDSRRGGDKYKQAVQHVQEQLFT